MDRFSMSASSYLEGLSPDHLLRRKTDELILHRCGMAYRHEGHRAIATEVHHQEEEVSEGLTGEQDQMTTATFQGGHIRGRGLLHGAVAGTDHTHTRDLHHAHHHQEDEEAHKSEVRREDVGVQATAHIAAIAEAGAGPGRGLPTDVGLEVVEAGS